MVWQGLVFISLHIEDSLWNRIEMVWSKCRQNNTKHKTPQTSIFIPVIVILNRHPRLDTKADTMDKIRKTTHSVTLTKYVLQIQGLLDFGRYRLLNTLLIVLMRLPMPPSCILLAKASSNADCVTEASVRV